MRREKKNYMIIFWKKGKSHPFYSTCDKVYYLSVTIPMGSSSTILDKFSYKKYTSDVCVGTYVRSINHSCVQAVAYVTFNRKC